MVFCYSIIKRVRETKFKSGENKMVRYFATTNTSNKRVEFTSKTIRAAKIKAGKEAIYANEVVKLFKDDDFGGQLLSVRREGHRWDDSFI